ncbi:adenylyl-sulfate kinase 3 [Selaginella moellendorffii]|nr:adenylyl-sulfate kinase 3 [Selaginella moellendorffii]|eukprot:XP_002987503.2 adenylyl-sulfate kinase 3 [Selaginella moellendorffii]
MSLRAPKGVGLAWQPENPALLGRAGSVASAKASSSSKSRGALFRVKGGVARHSMDFPHKNKEMDSCSSQDREDVSSKRSTTSPCLPGIIYPPTTTVGKSTNIFWQECMVKKQDREAMLGQKGCVVWITGLSASGKSTLACALDHALLSRGKLSYVLDGDNLRHGLNNNLGFSAEDRAENIRRVGEVAKLFADAGLICIASFISPYRKDRDSCRQLLPAGDFIEVYLKVPLSVCEKRDPKGLYKLARAGKIKGFTGIDDPYEEPHNCEIVMEIDDGAVPTPSEMADTVISFLEQEGYLPAKQNSNNCSGVHTNIDCEG